MNQSVNMAINALLALHLTKGVQPGELVDNVFEKEYINFSTKKNTDLTVILTFSYTEQGEESVQNVNCRYTYGPDKALLLIEQKIAAGRYLVQWCRDEAIAAAVDNVVAAFAKSGYSPTQIAASLTTLPDGLIPRVRAVLKAVA